MRSITRREPNGRVAKPATYAFNQTYYIVMIGYSLLIAGRRTAGEREE
jgi:hypothetical protein